MIFPHMLSFPKSHAIEGMIKFQFSFYNQINYEGLTKEEFLETIQHRLTFLDKTNTSATSEMFETRAPCTTLN